TSRLDDIDQPLVRADFELLSRLLIDVRAAQHRVTLDPSGERNGTMNDRPSALGGINDLRRRLVKHRVIVRLHADANSFLLLPSHYPDPLRSKAVASNHATGTKRSAPDRSWAESSGS